MEIYVCCPIVDCYRINNFQDQIDDFERRVHKLSNRPSAHAQKPSSAHSSPVTVQLCELQDNLTGSGKNMLDNITE